MVQFGFGSRAAALVVASMMASASVSAAANAPDPKGEVVASVGDNARAPVGPAKPTRYCVLRPTTGTILSGKICKTREQWLREGNDPLAKEE